MVKAKGSFEIRSMNEDAYEDRALRRPSEDRG
jgi:hypothetical protein